MRTIDWNNRASLMRVNHFATADDQEALVEQDTVRALVAKVLALPPAEQKGLLIRSATADDVHEYDTDTIRELGARPEFTGAHGDSDTADLLDDDELELNDDDETIIDNETSGPSHTDARGRDGER